MFEYFSNNSYGWNPSIMIALEGGGNINEIDAVCRGLEEKACLPEEEASRAWHDAWAEMAGRVEGLTARDEEAGNWLTAGRKYLRASIYFFVAERHLSHLDPQKIETYKRALASFGKGVKLGRDPVEIVEVPFGDFCLPALFVPAPGHGPFPCMIHFDGFDITKEILYLHHVGREYRRRGISVLIVDHPGVGEAMGRGVIDAAVGTPQFMNALKWYEVAKHVVTLSNGNCAADVTTVFNKTTWDSLDPSTCEVINDVTSEFQDKYVQALVESEVAQRKAMETNHGVSFDQLSPEAEAAFTAASKNAREVWFKKWDSQGMKTREVYEQFMRNLAKYNQEVKSKGYPWAR